MGRALVGFGREDFARYSLAKRLEWAGWPHVADCAKQCTASGSLLFRSADIPSAPIFTSAPEGLPCPPELAKRFVFVYKGEFPVLTERCSPMPTLGEGCKAKEECPKPPAETHERLDGPQRGSRGQQEDPVDRQGSTGYWQTENLSRPYPKISSAIARSGVVD